jgi:hypothetical protein
MSARPTPLLARTAMHMTPERGYYYYAENPATASLMPLPVVIAGDPGVYDAESLLRVYAAGDRLRPETGTRYRLMDIQPATWPGMTTSYGRITHTIEVLEEFSDKTREAWVLRPDADFPLHRYLPVRQWPHPTHPLMGMAAMRRRSDLYLRWFQMARQGRLRLADVEDLLDAPGIIFPWTATGAALLAARQRVHEELRWTRSDDYDFRQHFLSEQLPEIDAAIEAIDAAHHHDIRPGDSASRPGSRRGSFRQ